MYCAADRLQQHGPKAPGPNGLCLEFLTDIETWSLCRVLAQAVRRGSYRPGPERIIELRKPSGGTRRLVLQNAEDRVVGKALTLILQPLADRRFSPLSFGSRPECSPHVALTTAIEVSRLEGRWFWACADIKGAFDAVPQRRFLDACRRTFPGDVVDLIQTISATGKARGIRQGSPASPLFFNLFSDFFLDRKFAEQMPGVRLLRYVDDVLLLCRDASEGAAALQCLQHVAQVAGTPLKPATEVADIQAGDSLTWLGYQLQRSGDELAVRLTERAWERLAGSLTATQELPQASRRALRSIQGWLNYLAPCYPHADHQSVYVRLRQLAHQCAFDELPDDQWLRECWRPAYARWEKARKILRAQVPVRLDLQECWQRGEILPRGGMDIGERELDMVLVSRISVPLTKGMCYGSLFKTSWCATRKTAAPAPRAHTRRGQALAII
jgi:RNA-directed DNA polymerase